MEAEPCRSAVFKAQLLIKVTATGLFLGFPDPKM